MELAPDQVVADRFRLVRPLGEGGMGEVWLAHHIRLRIPCAVKFMRPDVAAQPSYRARFDREAVAAAQLRSPHVVQILDHGVWEDMPYIAMEYLEGEDLATRLARAGKLPAGETVAIVSQVARALAKAHDAGLVHRDLKPANIFLVRDDDREIAKVLDFGIAKVAATAAGEQTRTGAIVGTPAYMSPEQAQGTKSVDHRTDLWALGVLTFRCVTGQLPFQSAAFGDLVLKIIVDPIPVPSEVAAVPPGFDAWWAKAVARDPAARFQSAKELADELAKALDVGAITGGGLGAAAGASRPPAGAALAPSAAASSQEISLHTAYTEASVVVPGKAPPARSRTWVVAVLAGVVAVGAGGYVALSRGSGPPPSPPSPATEPPASAAPQAPAASPATAAPEPAASAPAPVAAPSASDLAPAASGHGALPAASAQAGRGAPSAAGRPTTPGSAKPAGTRAGAEGRDIGF